MPFLTSQQSRLLGGRGGYGPELLVNGGLDTAGAGGADVFAGWTESASTGAIAATTTAGEFRTGTAAKLTAGSSLLTRVEQVFAVTSGTQYELTMWTRGDGTYDGRYSVRDETNAADISASRVQTGVTGTTYQKITYLFTTPANCVSVRLYLFCPGTSGGVAFFDDVSVKRKL